MKKVGKKAISLFLTLIIVLGAAPLSDFMGVKDVFTTTANAESVYLSDLNVTRFINLFYVPGSEAAQNVEEILSGKREGTASEIKDICSKINLFLNVASDVDIDNMTINALSNISVVTNAIVGVFNIIDNYKQMQSSENALKKTVNGMQVIASLLQTINLGYCISPSFSMALSMIDITLNVAGYIERQNIKEQVELYRAELMIEYYAGDELTYKTAPNVSKLGITQEEADHLFAVVYFEWYFKQCMDRIGNNTGDGSDSEAKQVEKVSFATKEHTMFLNQTFTNTAVAYPADAEDRSITYHSAKTNVATVDSKGKITPVSPGTVDIIAKASNGVYDTCKLTVLPYTAEITGNEITILSYEGNGSAATIPSSVNGKTVVRIDSNAFLDCQSLVNVTIPNSITSIGDSAFKNCTNLKSITLPFVGDKRGGSGTEKDVFGYIFGYTSSSESETTLQNYSSSSRYYYYIPSSLETVVITDETVIPYGAFYDCKNITSITIPNSVTIINDYAFYHCENLRSITIPYGVTSIGNSAFRNCYYTTSITIPNSVTKIGSDAFYGCYHLKEITIPDSVTSMGSDAFEDCFSITSLTIGNGVTSIDSYAFEGCDDLTSVTIGNGVKSIGHSAFEDCKNLTSVTIGNGVTSIDYSAFEGCKKLTSIIIPDSVTSIGSSVFEGCESLTSVTIGNGVTNISYSAFEGCTSLKSIIIPDSVTSINLCAFYNCSSLTNITIPDSVTHIDGSAFGNCTSLANITIPNSVESIGYRAFYNCTSLTNITIPDSVTSIGDSAFEGCVSLTNITIPDSVTSIGDSAFEGCVSLTNIIIPGSVTTIGDSAFEGCVSLTSIIISDGVTSIGDSAFEGCIDLISITIPDSVTSIGDSAFEGCIDLISITIPDSVTSIGCSAFKNCTSLESITLPFIGNKIGGTGTENDVFGYIFGYTRSSDETGTTKQRYSLSFSAYYYIPSSLGTVVITNESELPYGAFYGCKYITSITIPDSVTRIDDYTFYHCESLISLIIPDCVTSIGECAFENCTSLTNITISNCVTNIYDFAFYNCIKLTNVYFNGSEDEWDTIDFNSRNDCLLNAKIYYNHTHSYSDVVVIPPGCFTTGYGYGICVCGHKTENYIIAAKEQHTAGDWEIVTSATCPQVGLKQKKCTVCDTVISEIPFTNHIDENMDRLCDGCQKKIFTATFTHNEDVIGTDQFVDSDLSLDYPEITTKEHYQWVWEDYSITDSDMTVNGEYVPIIYTATFVSEGKIIDVVEFTVENQTIAAPEIPAKAGYNAAWQKYEIQLADFVINAVYTPIPYTIRFWCEGELKKERPFTVEYTPDMFIMPALPSRIGYSVVWEKIEIAAHNIDVNATYVPLEYTATFYVDGEIYETQTFTVETERLDEPEIPEKTGYLAHWSPYSIKADNIKIFAKYDIAEVLLPTQKTLLVSENYRLTPMANFNITKKVWSSDDTSVATVSNSGKVTAIGDGECTVTVVCYGEDSFGKEISVEEEIKIVVKSKDDTDNPNNTFREWFDEFFEVTLYEILAYFKEMFTLFLKIAY